MTKVDKIRKLKKEGKSNRNIAKMLKCSETLVFYYTSEAHRKNTLAAQRRSRAKNPVMSKLEMFTRIADKRKRTSFKRVNPDKLTPKQLFSILSKNPVCYLTGEKINLLDKKTYHLDHKVPRSRGGSNTLSNLGLATKAVNIAKSNLTPEEFISLCIKVISHAGYSVKKNIKVNEKIITPP